MFVLRGLTCKDDGNEWTTSLLCCFFVFFSYGYTGLITGLEVGEDVAWISER